MILSDEQKAAIASSSQIICILACAGSGKTTTLTNRIAHLINKKDINPESVAAITFTVLAGEHLKHEIAQLINDKSAISRMFIGTIHSFCYHLLQSENAIPTESISPITEGQKFVLLSKYWTAWEIEKVALSISKSRLIESLILSFDIIKMDSIPLDTLNDDHSELVRVYKLYNRFLEENGYVDFADMLIRVRDLILNNKEFRERIISQYPYIFIDEYQDVDPVQAEIVSILQTNCSICVVGDDDQAIYQFRGADERNIQSFAKQANCETLPLSENRRCPKNVLAVGENCISKVISRLPKSMFTKIPHGIVACKQFNEIGQEVSYIREEISKLRSSGLIESYGQIGILFRSLASSGARYIDMMKKSGIPYVARGAKALFDSLEISKLLSIIEWFAKEDDSISYLEILTPIFSARPNIEKLSKFSDISALLKEEEWISSGMNAEDWRLIRNLHDIRIRYEEKKFGSLLELIHDFIETLGVMAPNRDELGKYNIAQFTRIIDEYETIQNNRNFRTLGAFLNTYAQRTYDEDTPLEKFDNAVNMLTVHQAKGLEFDYVFIPMLLEKRFPLDLTQKRWLIKDKYFDYKRYLTSVENERRLFYVACTRAKRGLFLLSSKNIGLKNQRKPSIFWNEARKTPFPEKNAEPPQKAVRKEKKRRLTAGYSSLEYYLTCPYRYQLIIEYGLRFPQVVYFQFGKLIHDVFAYINLGWKSDNPVTLEKAQSFFVDKFPLYYKNTNMREYDILKQKYRGKKIIDAYYKNRIEWHKNVIDLEKDFSFYSDLALIRGRYDVLISNPRNKYTIMDYKTGQAHAGLRPDFQMQFYSIAANDQLNLLVDEAIIYYVEKDAYVRYEVSPDFLAKGKANLDKTITGIISKDFQATPNKGVCSQCEVKKICPDRI